MNADTPAGWHPDPHGAPQLRWWDGTNWTDHTHPLTPASATGASTAAPESATQPGAPPVDGPPTSHQRSRAPLVIFGAVAALAVLGAGLFLLLRDNGDDVSLGDLTPGGGAADIDPADVMLDGAVRWDVDIGVARPQVLDVDDGVALVHSFDIDDSVIVGLDLASGEVLWRDDTYETIFAQAATLADGRAFHFATTEGPLVARDARTGEQLWTFEVGRLSRFFVTSTAVAISVDGGTVALDPASGDIAWEFDDQRLYIASELAVYAESRGDDPTLQAYDLATGTPRWDAPSDAVPSLAVRGAVPPDGPALLLERDGAAVGVDPSSGEVLWERPLFDGDGSTEFAFVGDSGLVLECVIATSGEELRSIDLTTGEVLGEILRPPGTLYVLAYDDDVIVSSDDADSGGCFDVSGIHRDGLTGFDTSTGRQRWRLDASDPDNEFRPVPRPVPASQPSLLGADTIVQLGATGDRTYVDTATGQALGDGDEQIVRVGDQLLAVTFDGSAAVATGQLGDGPPLFTHELTEPRGSVLTTVTGDVVLFLFDDRIIAVE